MDGDPCNECEVCRGIDDGVIMDVVEIDAASNNGVDSIRDLREEVIFTPAVAKYRVYIIDEVHMLSTGAFNALAQNAGGAARSCDFILATTEVHKLPATILSRCQRFDFAVSRRRILPPASRISRIRRNSPSPMTRPFCWPVWRTAGCATPFRCWINACPGPREVTEDTVVEATGMAGRDHLFELSGAVRNRTAGRLTLMGRLHGASKDMERLCTELIDFYRSLMVQKRTRSGGLIVALPPTEPASGRKPRCTSCPPSYIAWRACRKRAGAAPFGRIPPGGDGNGLAVFVLSGLDRTAALLRWKSAAGSGQERWQPASRTATAPPVSAAPVPVAGEA